MLFDTHAHLSEASHSELASIDYPILNVTTDASQWQAAIDFHQQNAYLLPALGIHPWFVTQQSFADIDLLENYIERESVIAIGEIGLDFQKQHLATKELQLAIFECQLELAQRHNLPVSIHVIKAHNEMSVFLKEYSIMGVIHGLGASIEVARAYIDLGYKIGVNAVCCRENARRYHQMLVYFGLNHFVLETDYPNICLPNADIASLADLQQVASCIVDIKNISIAEVIQQTSYNARQVFKLIDK